MFGFETCKDLVLFVGLYFIIFADGNFAMFTLSFHLQNYPLIKYLGVSISSAKIRAKIRKFAFFRKF